MTSLLQTGRDSVLGSPQCTSVYVFWRPFLEGEVATCQWYLHNLQCSIPVWALRWTAEARLRSLLIRAQFHNGPVTKNISCGDEHDHCCNFRWDGAGSEGYLPRRADPSQCKLYWSWLRTHKSEMDNKLSDRFHICSRCNFRYCPTLTKSGTVSHSAWENIFFWAKSLYCDCHLGLKKLALRPAYVVSEGQACQALYDIGLRGILPCQKK